MSEGSLWEKLRKGMRDHQGWREATRHEDAYQRGIADVSFVSCGGNHGWLELKHLYKWPAKPTTPVRIDHLTEDQKYWLALKGAHGGRTWLLLQVGRAHLLYHWSTVKLLGTLLSTEMYEKAEIYWDRTIDYATLGKVLDSR